MVFDKDNPEINFLKIFFFPIPLILLFCEDKSDNLISLLVDNLKLAQKYNFKGGTKGLMEMAKWPHRRQICYTLRGETETQRPQRCRIAGTAQGDRGGEDDEYDRPPTPARRLPLHRGGARLGRAAAPGGSGTDRSIHRRAAAKSHGGRNQRAP